MTVVSIEMLTGFSAVAVQRSIDRVDQYFTVAAMAPAVTFFSVEPLDRSFGTGAGTGMLEAEADGEEEGAVCPPPCAHGGAPHPTNASSIAPAPIAPSAARPRRTRSP